MLLMLLNINIVHGVPKSKLDVVLIAPIRYEDSISRGGSKVAGENFKQSWDIVPRYRK